MKVLILYASYGNGHKSAAFAIKDYLEKFYENVEVEIVDSYRYINKALNATTVKGYDFFSSKTPAVWENIYYKSEKGVLSKISTEMNRLASHKLLKLINNSNPDVIVSTHMFNNNMCGRLKRKGKVKAKLVSIITDFALHNEWLVNGKYIDCFCVSNNAMKLDLIKRGFDENKIFVTGIPISPNFYTKFDLESVKKEFNLSDKKTILFFAASTYTLGNMEDILKVLLTLDNYQIIVLCGKNEKTKLHFQEIVNNAKKADTIKVLPFTTKVPALMNIADFVVTKPGGLTSSEALACDLPMIICNPIPGQEDHNSNFLLNNGVAIRLFDNEDMEITLKDFLSNEKRIAQIHDMIKIVGKPNSTKDICELILK